MKSPEKLLPKQERQQQLLKNNNNDITNPIEHSTRKNEWSSSSKQNTTTSSRWDHNQQWDSNEHHLNNNDNDPPLNGTINIVDNNREEELERNNHHSSATSSSSTPSPTKSEETPYNIAQHRRMQLINAQGSKKSNRNDTNSSLPTASSTGGSIGETHLFSECDSAMSDEHKSWNDDSTFFCFEKQLSSPNTTSNTTTTTISSKIQTIASKESSTFSYKDILMLNDCQHNSSTTTNDPSSNSKRVKKVAVNSSDKLFYTKEHTSGTKFAKLGGPRMDVKIIREAINQAINQGVIDKSTKRSLRQSLLRGDTTSVLESIRRACHVRPVVSPIRIDTPSTLEAQASASLTRYINEMIAPSSKALTTRHIAKMEIERIVHEWVAASSSSTSSSSLVLIGEDSYLRTQTQKSTLVLVALVPISVSTESFYTSLRRMLISLTNTSVTSNTLDTSLSFTYNCTTNVTLKLSRFTQPKVPHHLPIHADHVISGMDTASIRNLSATRTAALILELVPNPTSFRIVCSAVSAWAEARGLVGDRVGFLSTTALSVSVAFTCQLLPTACPATILHNYFIVMACWDWPTPMRLAIPYEAGLGISQWNPTLYIRDKSDVLPIISPGYPATNVASSVNYSTARVLQEEWVRGSIIMDGIMAKKDCNNNNIWSKLFEPTDFSVRYNHYLKVSVNCPNLKCLVEYKIRKLVTALQHTEGIVSVHPLPAAQIPSCDDDVFSYYVGFETIDGPSSADGVVNPVLNYFKATELQTAATDKKTMMIANVLYLPWASLPQELFKKNSDDNLSFAGTRARFLLRQAHDKNLMINAQFYQAA